LLDPTIVTLIAQSIAEVILALAIPAYRRRDRRSRASRCAPEHPASAVPLRHKGYLRQVYTATHQPSRAFTIGEVIAVLRDNLARHDPEDLSAFYQIMGWETSDDASHVGFVLGWLIAVIEHGKALVSPMITLPCDEQKDKWHTRRVKRR
jgi:hypothetical protein